MDDTRTLAAATRLSISTIRRWRHGLRLHRGTKTLLDLAAAGQIVPQTRTWHGWRFEAGLLWSPCSYTFTADNVRDRGYQVYTLESLVRIQDQQLRRWERLCGISSEKLEQIPQSVALAVRCLIADPGPPEPLTAEQRICQQP